MRMFLLIATLLVVVASTIWFFGPAIRDAILMERNRMRVDALTRRTQRHMNEAARDRRMRGN
jgi:hypothetical protein